MLTVYLLLKLFDLTSIQRVFCIFYLPILNYSIYVYVNLCLRKVQLLLDCTLKGFYWRCYFSFPIRVHLFSNFCMYILKSQRQFNFGQF